MQNLTPEGLRIVTDAATRHGVSLEAALAALGALAQGQGRQAQFDHPELGGMGQWSQGGMIMIGDMFNSGLKARVDALLSDLADLLRSQPLAFADAGVFSRKAGAAAGSVCSWRGAARRAHGGRRSLVGLPRSAPRTISATPAFPMRVVWRSSRADRFAFMTPASTGSRVSPSNREAISR